MKCKNEKCDNEIRLDYFDGYCDDCYWKIRNDEWMEIRKPFEDISMMDLIMYIHDETDHLCWDELNAAIQILGEKIEAVENEDQER